MSRLRGGAFVTSLVTIATLIALPAPLATAATGTPSVNSVNVSPSTVSLTRKQTDTITVSVHLVVPGGQSPPAVVDRGSGVDFARSPLSLFSGSAADGVWHTQLTAGSMMDGTHPLSVEVCPTGRDCAANGPLRVSLDAPVTVNGTDWPVLASVAQDPRRLSPGHAGDASAVGRVVYSATRVPAGGVDVVLRRGHQGAGVVTDTSNANGAFTSPWPWPATNTGTPSLWLRHPGVPGVTFGRHQLGFAAATFAVRTTHAPAIASLNRRYTVSGFVTPGFPAQRLGSVVLETRRGDRWGVVDRSRLRSVTKAGEPMGRARFTLTTSISQVGHHTFRVRKPAALCGKGPCRVAEGTSSRFNAIIGNHAYFVERRLAQLSVPVGAVDGVIDARARQALCAWRDMSGGKPSRNGLTRRLADSVLSAHRLPRPHRSDGLYVSKTCQILLQVVHHKFRRVVWASSGQPGFETPNGTGAIFRKLPGPVESTLYPGAFMYHPMFFFPSRPGIALHGSATNDLVLPYPASHGCIRVWRPDIVQIYNHSPLGTKVKVYGKY